MSNPIDEFACLQEESDVGIEELPLMDDEDEDDEE